MNDDSEWLPPSFEAHLRVEPPEALFHYTGQDGFLGIINSGSFWATKVQYMNDATEFELALRLAKLRIEAFSQKSYRSELERVITRYKILKQDEIQYDQSGFDELKSALEGLENINIFSVCFCEEPDLLSQWRGYAGDVYGYSLGFTKQTLRDAGNSSRFILGKCIYEQALQEAIIDEAIERCLSTRDKLAPILFKCGSFFKDTAFKEEQEWRLVSPVRPMTAVRRGKSMLVPYFNLPIRDGNKAFIRCVYIGPCPHRELSRSAVSLWLSTTGAGMPLVPAGLGDVPDVRVSSIPFRNW